MGQEEWERYRSAKERPGDVAEFVEIEEDGIKRKIVVTSEGEAQAFCWWLAESGIQAGFLTVNHQARQLMDVTFNNAGLSERARKENFRPFRCRVEPISSSWTTSSAARFHVSSSRLSRKAFRTPGCAATSRAIRSWTSA